MRYFILFILFSSCAPMSSRELSLKDELRVLESYSPSWDRKKITDLLGKPRAAEKKSQGESWFYYSSATGFQSWVIGLTPNDTSSGLAYFPTSSGKTLSIMDLEKRWASKKCEHKKETQFIAGHHYTEVRRLVCDGGKIVVDYNQYNEVSGIYVK